VVAARKVKELLEDKITIDNINIVTETNTSKMAVQQQIGIHQKMI